MAGSAVDFSVDGTGSEDVCADSGFSTTARATLVAVA